MKRMHDCYETCMIRMHTCYETYGLVQYEAIA